MKSAHYQTFLSELDALDDFMERRRRGSRMVPQEDPDVRRLMESLAFFSARTREAADEALRGSVHRLVQGHLDDYLTPQPTRGMLRASAGARLTDPVRLPRGARVRLQTMDGDIGMFTTMRDVTIRPLQLQSAELQMRGRSGFRILVRLRSRGPCPGLPEPLALNINHLGDYMSSLRLYSRLRDHLEKVWVVYDKTPAPSDRPLTDPKYQECDFSFGSAGAADDLTDVANRLYRGPSGSVAKIREFFHLPQKELYLNVNLAPPANRSGGPSAWREAWLCLDVDGKWPEDQIVAHSSFRLFVVPIENLFLDPAEPIKADGTRTAHPIVPWQPEGRASFHSVVEVSQDKATGTDVILPAYLASGRESYDVEYRGEQGQPHLLLRLPDAFADPRMVTVRALWHQPWFDDAAVGKLEARLQTRHIEGVEFEVQGELVHHRESPLWSDSSSMLQVMSRRSKRTLNRQDIVKLMWLLGADETGAHGDVAADLLHVEVREEPAGVGRGGGIVYVYVIRLADGDDDRCWLQDDYLDRVEELLGAWSSNPVRTERIRKSNNKVGR